MGDVLDVVEVGWRVTRFLRAVVSARARHGLAAEWLEASPGRAAAMVVEGVAVVLILAVLLVAAWRAAA